MHQIVRQAVRFMTNQPFDDRKNDGKARSLPVGYFDHLDPSVTPGRRGRQGCVADAFERRWLMQWNGEIGGFPVDQDAITVDPSALDVIHIVVYDEAIDGTNELPVADVREEIGLHDGKFHCNLSPSPATFA